MLHINNNWTVFEPIYVVFLNIKLFYTMNIDKKKLINLINTYWFKA